MQKEAPKINKGPAPKGPYSPAIAWEKLLFISGQGPIHPQTGEFKLASIEEETHQTLSNLKTILEECGSSLDKVLKVTVFLDNLEDFDRMNAVYKTYFPECPPARACVQSGLLFNTHIEIDAIAYKD